MIYVDTSLLLPTYLPEVHSARANEVLKSSSALFLSDLVVAEFHVGLERKVKLGEVTRAQADEARAAFERHLTERLLLRIPFLPIHSEAAGRLAAQSTSVLRTLDALHLAIAAHLGLGLATLDGRLATAARGLGFEVLPAED